MKIYITSCTNDNIEISEDLLKYSTLLYDMVFDYDDDEDQIIPFTLFDTYTIKKTFEFLEIYINDFIKYQELNNLVHYDIDDEFITKSAFFNDIGNIEMFKILKFADFLDVGVLVEVICTKIASLIKYKNPDQIREIFCISDDLNSEELEEFSISHTWSNGELY